MSTIVSRCGAKYVKDVKNIEAAYTVEAKPVKKNAKPDEHTSVGSTLEIFDEVKLDEQEN
jgi:hypothetical protein